MIKEKIHIYCNTVSKTEAVILVLLANGFKWRSGATTVKPKVGSLYPKGNIIFINNPQENTFTYSQMYIFNELNNTDERFIKSQTMDSQEFLNTY